MRDPCVIWLGSCELVTVIILGGMHINWYIYIYTVRYITVESQLSLRARASYLIQSYLLIIF